MRLKQLALLVSMTALTLSGCSSGRSMSGSDQIVASNDRPVVSNYDHDPPSPVRPRVAIQPAPVPPVSSSPRIRGISFLKVLGHSHGHCVEEPCVAKANVGCGVCEDTCTSEACGEECGDTCKAACRTSWATKCLSALKQKCVKKSGCSDECATEETCTVPAEEGCQTECAESECGETSCCKPWYRKLCLPKIGHSCCKDECVEECGEADEECCTDTDDCCADEGCNKPKQHCRLLTCLLDSAMHNPLCRLKPRLGSFCRASCGKGCGDEGCAEDDSCGSECGQTKHCQGASPLADCLAEDPFAEQHTEETSQPQKTAVPDVPDTPANPAGKAGATEQYEQPKKVPANTGGTEKQLTPPPPVPPTPVGQAYEEPQIWPRLKADEEYNTDVSSPAKPVQPQSPVPAKTPARVTNPPRTTAMQHVWHY